ncbi:MAG: hypothetical protein ACRDZW_06695 [Acidimicrobiales bacterium]
MRGSSSIVASLSTNLFDLDHAPVCECERMTVAPEDGLRGRDATERRRMAGELLGPDPGGGYVRAVYPHDHLALGTDAEVQARRAAEVDSAIEVESPIFRRRVDNRLRDGGLQAPRSVTGIVHAADSRHDRSQFTGLRTGIERPGRSVTCSAST